MARTAAALPSGKRTTDFISLGVIAKTFSNAKVHAVLAETGKSSVRQRELPAHVMVYYVIAMALFMNASCREVLRWLLEGLQWLRGFPAPIKVTGKSGISQARTRLGDEVLRRLHDETVRPIATPSTKGAWFKHWRLVSLDGSTLDVADEPALEAAFGRPGAGHGESAYPQIRFVSLVENGTHVLFGTHMAGCATSEIALDRARRVGPARGHAVPGGSKLLRLRNVGSRLRHRRRPSLADQDEREAAREKRLPDGSYLSYVYPSDKDRRQATNGVKIRVIEYRLEGVADAEPIYRLVTTILDPTIASAEELAALYHERWEIETALDELKTHVRGAKILLRSKTPELVRQEFFGLMMLHFAVRGLMHEAALRADEDPDRLSFLHAIRVVRRKLPIFGAIPPSGQACAA